jgi:hypothetical protein
VGLSFWCKLKGGDITIFVPEPHMQLNDGEKLVASFTISNQHFDLPGEGQRNTDTQSGSFETTVKADHAIFQSIAEAAFLSVRIKSKSMSFPLDTANIRDLTRACAP